MPVEHFKSKETYRKWNAYTHMHGIPTHVQTAVIAGRPHKVQHSEKKARAKRATKK